MNLREICFKFYRKAERMITPGLKYSQTIYEDVLQEYSVNKEYWLDLGCGYQLLPSWRLDQERKLVQRPKVLMGLDYDLASLKRHKTICYRVQGDMLRLPFVNSSFNLVTSNMVFEHLKEPKNQLQEISRILKPGGILIFHTPNVFSYGTLIARLIPEFIKAKVIHFFQGREEADIFPAYYRINSTRSIENAADFVDLEISSMRLIVSSAQLVMVPPLVILELVFIRLLMSKLLKSFRTNIIAILQKPNKLANQISPSNPKLKNSKPSIINLRCRYRNRIQ